MKTSELDELMQAVLDGEATPEQARELERRLAADPAARAEFGQLKHLFDGLAGVPKQFPPEGLVASVMSRLPRTTRKDDDPDQLFATSGVIGQTSKGTRGSRPGDATTVRRVSQPGPFFRGEYMSEQNSGFPGKRKV